ncbi:hypothetical protein [Yoonia sp.]|uniref:hypothetical protein n=1 Tax=Yoonia sp. TaxID=2212373 RepID=UPI0025EBFB8E|nr:hypothetical protein [Yoonia sp.]
MKWTFLAAIAIALGTIVPVMSYAQDQTQDRLQECGNLNDQDCADLLRIREQLMDCDGVTSDECAALLRERERLQTCVDGDQDRDRDRDQDRDQDCEPAQDGSGGSGKN